MRLYSRRRQTNVKAVSRNRGASKMDHWSASKQLSRLQTTDSSEFLGGGGQVGELMRSLDWSQSPLGPPARWPQSLRTVVGLLLQSRFPMFVAWGSELGFLYNDSYAEILGAKHPAALGRRFHDIWSEIWPDISPLIDAAMNGDATYRRNRLLEQLEALADELR